MILVTGATGYLGSRIAHRLAGSGETVRLLVRDPARAPRPEGAPVEIVVGDVTDRDRRRRAAAGCDAVVHAAALVREWASDRRLFDRVNVEATLALLDDAADARRVLVVSSFLALGPADDRPADETSEPSPDHRPGNDYERTKREADVLLRRRIAEGDERVVVVYPGVLVGPGARTAGNLVARLIVDHARGRLPGLPGDGRRAWSYVHVDDVARGVALALKGPGGARWVLGGENASQREFWDLVSRLAGLPPLRRRIPLPLARAVAAVRFAAARFRGREPAMTPGALRIFDHDWSLDSTRARTELGWEARGLEEALRDTIAWLRREGEIAA